MDSPMDMDPKFVAVVDDIVEYCMNARGGKWKGGFSGVAVIALPTDQNATLGNVAGFFDDKFQDDQDEVMANMLVSFLTGMLLMGWDETMLYGAVEAARHIANKSDLVDMPNLPEN